MISLSQLCMESVSESAVWLWSTSVLASLSMVLEAEARPASGASDDGGIRFRLSFEVEIRVDGWSLGKIGSCRCVDFLTVGLAFIVTFRFASGAVTRVLFGSDFRLAVMDLVALFWLSAIALVVGIVAMK